jgi:hypothetical protein
MSRLHDRAARLGSSQASGLLISEQIEAIEAELAAGADSVADLSNSGAAASGQPRRTRWPAGMPVLLAVRSGVQLAAWCPYCRREHWHGAHDTARCGGAGCPCPRHGGYRGPCLCPPGTGDGHRAAHCASPASPLRATGYWIMEVTP